MSKKPKAVLATPIVKLDIGCGKRKCAPEWTGVDIIPFEGVDIVMDIRKTPWPWEDNEVAEVFASHFFEHLRNDERVVFMNELYRVMRVGSQARIISPNWSHVCAYGDPTHQWPPVGEWAAYYWNKEWREREAPHATFTCDFDFVVGGSWDAWLEVKNGETRMFAMQRYVNSCRDIIFTITKRAP